MQAIIQKWGNSQGIRIPKAFLEALGMAENDLVELSRVDDNIVITKVKEKRSLLWKIFSKILMEKIRQRNLIGVLLLERKCGNVSSEARRYSILGFQPTIRP